MNNLVLCLTCRQIQTGKFDKNYKVKKNKEIGIALFYEFQFVLGQYSKEG